MGKKSLVLTKKDHPQSYQAVCKCGWRGEKRHNPANDTETAERNLTLVRDELSDHECAR